MRPVTVSITGNGATQNSAPVVVDQYIAPLQLGLAFKTTGVATTFKVQYSLDDPFAVYATDYNTNGTWFDLTGMNAMTTNTSGKIDDTTVGPVRAVRLQGNNAGTETGTLTVVQSGRA